MLAQAVENGVVPEAHLDQAVRRALRDKFALGLFENPYVPEDPVEIRARAHAGTELSRRLAAESVTLLKNDDGLLPLGRDIEKVAVIGPPRRQHDRRVPRLHVSRGAGAAPGPGPRRG